MKKKIYWILIGFAVPICALVVASLTFGSFGATASWLYGKPFYLYPQIVRLENRAPGLEEVVTFQLKNLASEDISVVGEKSSCTCAFSENIPITVKPGEVAAVKIRVRLPKYKTSYDQSVLLMIATAEKLKFAEVRIVANIPNPLPLPPENLNEELIELPTQEAGGTAEAVAAERG